MTAPDLEALLAEYGTWESALEYEKLRLEEASDDSARSATLSRIGRLALLAGDRDGARAALEEAVDLDVSDDVAADALADLYGSLDLWRDRVALQLDRLEIDGPGSRRAGLLADIAAAYAGPLREPDAALLVVRKAVAETPAEPAVAQAAEDLARLFPDEAAAILDELAEAIERAEGPRAAIPTLARAARARTAAGRADLAQIRWERIATLDPGNADADAGLEAIYIANDDRDELIELLMARAQRTDDADARAEALRRAATLAAEHDPAAEAAALVLLWERDDASDAELSRLGALRTASGDSAGAIATLRARAERVDGPARAALLAEIASALASTGDSVAADAEWRRAFDADPTHPAAIDALERIARAEGDHAALLRALDARRPGTEGDARAALDLERAELLASQHDADAAVAVLEAILAERPAHAGAFGALVALHEAAERPREVIRCLLDRSRADVPEAEVIALLGRAAELAERALDDRGEALAYVREALARAGETPPLLRDLARLHEALGQREEAVAALDRLAAAGDQSERIATLLEKAKLQREADDPAQVATWHEILAADPAHAEAFAALDAWHTQRGEHRELAELLRTRAETERDLSVRGALQARLGAIRSAALGDEEGARTAWETALEFDPDNSDAATALLDRYADDGAWERVAPLAERLLRNTGEALAPPDRANLQALHGAALESLGRGAEAAALYEQALAADPDHTDLVVPLARLLGAAGRNGDAAALWRSVIDHHLDLWPAEEQPALLHEAATALEAAGDSARAAAAWELALRVDPWFVPALRAVARGGASGVSAEAREAAAKHLLQLEDDPAARLALTLEIADQLAADGDLVGAVESLKLAVELDPSSRAALHRLLDLFMRTEQWRRAAEVLGRLAELETSPARVHRLLLTIAALFREQLDAPMEAVPFLQRILDEDPRNDEARDTLEQILVDAGALGDLERLLRRHVETLTTDDGADAGERAVATLHRLARLYLDALGRVDDAIAAWRLVLRLDPRDASALEAIATTYPSSGKSDEDSIAEHQALLAVRPDRVDSWHMLFSAYRRRREFDRAWRTAAVLVVLGAAEPHEQRFYDEHRPPSVVMTPHVLGAEDLPQLMHPGLDYLLTRLFAVLAQTVAPAFAQDPRVLGVNPRRDRLDAARPEPAVAIALWAQRVFGVGAFDLVRRAGPTGIAHANLERPTLLLGDDVLQAAPDRVLVFRIARAVALLRPELYFAATYNSADALKTFVYAAFAVFTGQVVPAPTVEAVSAVADTIRRVPEPALSELGRCVNGFLASNVSPDVSLWLRGAHLTAARAGLVLCGDLTRAVEGAQWDPHLLGRVDVQDCRRDLVLYFASEACELVRAQLRLGLGQA
jgi:tetratricopeptide (TPR) repeat protein